MSFSLCISPFKDYWLNCSFNMMFSILISNEPSFRMAAYLNDYSYRIQEIETPTGTKIHYLSLCPMRSFEKKYLSQNSLLKQPIYFKSNQNCVDYLKSLIQKQLLITVGVDLFYWIPDSVCWNKHHWEHYSFINGFNNERKAFYVFDENIHGYDQFEIPEERFCTAIKNSPLDPHGYIYEFSNDIGSFEFSLSEVICNAKQLSDEIKAMNFNTLWELSDADLTARHMCDLMSIYLYQIANRHKANQLLFQVLHEKNMINGKKEIDILIMCSKNLQNSWLVEKDLLVKAYATRNKRAEITLLNEKCKDLLIKEYEMWSEFISCTEI